MTNMMPQAPDNNQGPWEVLESYCRTLVSQGDELYIIAGGTGIGGTGSNGGTTTTIANGHVTVPAQTWKVIIVLPQGTDDVSRVTTATRTIAVIMPNLETGAAMWEALLHEGLYVNLARPPATPAGMTLLRCSLCALHSEEQVGEILGMFAAAGRATDCIS